MQNWPVHFPIVVFIGVLFSSFECLNETYLKISYYIYTFLPVHLLHTAFDALNPKMIVKSTR